MLDAAVSFFPSRDGVRLAYREVGAGRPLVLLHGLAGDGTLWLRHGQAETFAARGHRVILPDARGHGRSAKPHDAAAYPPDVLTDDGLALVEHLGLDDYDLGGYSLGARIVVRMLVRGATPGRAVVAGQGMRQVLGLGGGAGSMLRQVLAGGETFAPGSPEERTGQWLRSSGADPVALLRVLDSVVATPVESVRRIEVPTLVVMGADDERAGSVDELVAALPQGTRAVVPGDHATAVAAPELAAAIGDFLADPMTENLPVSEFGFPGPLRDKLVAAILDGTKTTTTGLRQDYEIDDEPLPVVGARAAVVDSAGRRVAVIEMTEVRVSRLGDVDWDHARDEGEGDDSVAAWRAGHEDFWHGTDYRGWLGDPGFTVDDDTVAVLVRFRLVARR